MHLAAAGIWLSWGSALISEGDTCFLHGEDSAADQDPAMSAVCQLRDMATRSVPWTSEVAALKSDPLGGVHQPSW